MKNLDSNHLTFKSEDSWMVQCLTLAAVGILAYLHMAPTIASMA